MVRTILFMCASYLSAAVWVTVRPAFIRNGNQRLITRGETSELLTSDLVKT